MSVERVDYSTEEDYQQALAWEQEQTRQWEQDQYCNDQSMEINSSNDAVFARLMRAMRENASRIKALPIGVTNDEWFAATARRSRIEKMLHDLVIKEARQTA